jgi:dTDP-4-dehydrorhamnose 3,5-epimerase
VQPLGIEGAWVYTPAVHGDDRGSFAEQFRGAEFAADLGYRLDIAQVNCSVSQRGVGRGIHYADVPPGQAKYVSCLAGTGLDVIIDIRVGSPTFGKWEAVRLDATSRRSVFISEGLGHAFMALTDDATLLYLCSTPYAPGREHGVHPLDPGVGIDWPTVGRDGSPLTHSLSPKDEQAPPLADLVDSGLLATYAEAQDYVQGLRIDL